MNQSTERTNATDHKPAIRLEIVEPIPFAKSTPRDTIDNYMRDVAYAQTWQRAMNDAKSCAAHLLDNLDPHAIMTETIHGRRLAEFFATTAANGMLVHFSAGAIHDALVATITFCMKPAPFFAPWKGPRLRIKGRVTSLDANHTWVRQESRFEL